MGFGRVDGAVIGAPRVAKHDRLQPVGRGLKRRFAIRHTTGERELAVPHPDYELRHREERVGHRRGRIEQLGTEVGVLQRTGHMLFSYRRCGPDSPF